MIILDTNVLSEPLKTRPDSRVLAWLDEQASGTLYLTAVSLSELLIGVEIMVDGRRKKHLAAAVTDIRERLFTGRILAFDQAAACFYAPMVARARAAGHAVSAADGQIGAIAKLHGFMIASRDTAPFLALGLPILNPWEKV